MSESETIKINKHQYWQDKIEQWQTSNLSQSSYCEQSGIKLSTFGYWLKALARAKNKINKFASVKIIKDEMAKEEINLINIKLISGHEVRIPTEIGINEIAKLIRLLGLPHA